MSRKQNCLLKINHLFVIPSFWKIQLNLPERPRTSVQRPLVCDTQIFVLKALAFRSLQNLVVDYWPGKPAVYVAENFTTLKHAHSDTILIDRSVFRIQANGFQFTQYNVLDLSIGMPIKKVVEWRRKIGSVTSDRVNGSCSIKQVNIFKENQGAIFKCF